MEVGLHHGSSFSPFLFDLMIDDVTKGIHEEVSWNLLFADDVIWVDESNSELNDMLKELEMCIQIERDLLI